MTRIAKQLVAAAALALALNSAGAGLAKDKKASEARADNPAVKFNKNPYPSTYRPYPGQPVLITGATVFDGKGGRIDGGSVLLRDGKVVGVGGSLADLAVPADALRIDGTGKFVTPGSSMRIRTWASIPAPGCRPIPMATRRPRRPRRKSGRNIRSGRTIRAFRARWPMAG